MLSLRAQAERERRRRQRQAEAAALQRDWRPWLTALFARYAAHDFAPHHAAFWDWVWALTPGVRPHPLIAIWPRGGAKSTSAELACAAIAALQTRRYVLYVCETQERGDDHVQNVAGMLESPAYARMYPEAAARFMGKYGNSKGWRRNRLRTSSGFTIDAIGLDTAARGAKMDEDRPGLIIIDDIDGGLDTDPITQRKINTLTKALLPAGAPDLAVLGVQNLIHQDSIFSRMADGRADFLADREVSGPFPAIRDLRYEQRGARTVITGGDPVWAGQDLARCQSLIDDIGIRAFLSESQQEVVRDPDAALFKRAHIDVHRVVPDATSQRYARVVVSVDPSGSAGGDAAGIVVAALGVDGHGYVLEDATIQGSPDDWARAALSAYTRHAADRIVYETNFGGEMVASTIALTARHMALEDEATSATPALLAVHASRGKVVRAEPVSALYQQGRVHHIGTFPALEGEMCGWVQGDRSPNRMDALVWALTDLMLGPRATVWA